MGLFSPVFFICCTLELFLYAIELHLLGSSGHVTIRRRQLLQFRVCVLASTELSDARYGNIDEEEKKSDVHMGNSVRVGSNARFRIRPGVAKVGSDHSCKSVLLYVPSYFLHVAATHTYCRSWPESMLFLQMHVSIEESSACGDETMKIPHNK
jgi:hypothetical protein